MSPAAPPRAIRSPEGSWPTLSMSRREGVQLCNVATGRILEAPEYFRHGWMRITNYVAEALRNHIDTHTKSSNDRPGNLTGRRRAFMRPIIEFAGRKSPQNVPIKVVLNFEVYVPCVVIAQS